MPREATVKIDAAEIERILKMHFSAQRIKVEAIEWALATLEQREGPRFTGATIIVHVGD